MSARVIFGISSIVAIILGWYVMIIQRDTAGAACVFIIGSTCLQIHLHDSKGSK